MEKLNFELEDAKKGSQLIERERLGTSPIALVGNQDKGYAAVIGLKRLTGWFKSMDELKQWIEGNNWEFICMISATMVSEILEANDEVQKTIDE